MILDKIKKKQFKKAYELLKNLHPHDQAKELEKLNQLEKEKVLSYFTNSELAEILSYSSIKDSANIIKDYELFKQKEIFEQMDIDDTVDILDEFDTNDTNRIVSILDNKNELKELLSYSDDEVGSLMTNNYLKINSKMDVKDAMKELIKEAPTKDNINTLFVVDENKYLGTVKLNKLIKSKSPLVINEILVHTPNVIDTDDIGVVTQKMREYELFEIAVCNNDNEILGVVTLDDAIESYEEEAIEDFAKLSGVSKIEEKKILKSAIHRLPWLIILLIASIPIALASSMFEEIIVAVAILARFQPLILDASGDVATQTLAVTLRKISKEDKISLNEGLKEVLSGVINGVILGVISFFITLVMANLLKFNEPILVSLVVSLSLILTIIIGPIIGFLVPVTLNKLKLDPAVASGPFITTLVDILSLVIYFSLATILLGGLLV